MTETPYAMTVALRPEARLLAAAEASDGESSVPSSTYSTLERVRKEADDTGVYSV